jgi:hypothetical protein
MQNEPSDLVYQEHVISFIVIVPGYEKITVLLPIVENEGGGYLMSGRDFMEDDHLRRVILNTFIDKVAWVVKDSSKHKLNKE